MVFASYVFLYAFLPLFLAVYAVCPRAWRSWWIALASYVFYGWWRPDFTVLMLCSTLLDYVCGLGIQRDRALGRDARRWVWASCLVNLGLLGYFKYANFGIDTLNELLAAAGHAPVSWTRIVLPVGISFYTFQTLSYTIDVYRGDAPPVRSFRDFACFVSMFPQLVAGPIVRYNTVAEQLRERTHTLSKAWRGVLFIQAGLAKKILLADTLAPLADQAFAAPHGAGATWLGTLAYAFQIYFDFSGYSDMAIGLGLLIGFRFPINFDSPYKSTSITDFWRRWHVSLSTFLRDYLYVPLGGNRKGPLRTYVNLALVMLLGGLWHGAAWTFVAWGAWQGLWLIVERLAGRGSLLRALPGPFQVASTFVLVLFGWVLFRAPSVQAAVAHAAALLGATVSAAALEVRPIHWLAFATGAVIVWLLPNSQRLVHAARPAWALALQPVFLLALLTLYYHRNVPFLYFQF